MLKNMKDLSSINKKRSEEVGNKVFKIKKNINISTNSIRIYCHMVKLRNKKRKDWQKIRENYWINLPIILNMLKKCTGQKLAKINDRNYSQLRNN